MRNFNVLVFPAGKENSIEIYNALKDSMNITLFGASSVKDHGAFAFTNYTSNLPFIYQSNFIEALNEYIAANSIDIIFPTHDTISMFLAEHRESINAKVAAADYETCRIARYKDKTYQLFAEDDFCPVIYKADNELPFPVFIKPIVGEASLNTKVVKSREDLRHFENLDKDYVIAELLPGDELTIDCFTDRHGVLRFVGPRKRNRTHLGISLNSHTVPLTDELKGIAEGIGRKMKMRGLWFFQVKQDAAGKYKLLEVCVRTAGTMMLYRNLGANLPLLTVYDFMDIDFNISTNDMYIEVDRCLISKFKIGFEFDDVYIDFDDTITRKGKVNEFVMLFLYKMRNAGKRLHLLTRHEYDLDETFNRLAISKNVFDEIIHTTWEFKKSHHIKEKERSIFIDNSYAERLEVSRSLGIPVFDVDAIECLIDWKN